MFELVSMKYKYDSFYLCKTITIVLLSYFLLNQLISLSFSPLLTFTNIIVLKNLWMGLKLAHRKQSLNVGMLLRKLSGCSSTYLVHITNLKCLPYHICMLVNKSLPLSRLRQMFYSYISDSLAFGCRLYHYWQLFLNIWSLVKQCKWQLKLSNVAGK